MKSAQAGLWAVILAGGDGKRLLPLASRLAGDARPKQFCAILGGETLLECTRRRADLVCRFDRQVVVVNRRHEAHYAYLARELAPGRLVVQPGNRDTGPGIVYPLFRVAELAGEAPVVILPSDHYVSDDALFMEHVQAAVDLVRALPETVVLLGIRATSPETDYGWIEASEMPLLQGEGVFEILGFWERPSPTMARWLLARGGLWNSFVIVGWVSRLLDLVEATAPELLAALEPVRRALGSLREAAVAEAVYAALPSINFSRSVLACGPDRFVTMPVSGLEWSDLGDPRRVVATLRRRGQPVPWLAEATASWRMEGSA
jgi:mannose-1-phosphate guanylyltransferase